MEGYRFSTEISVRFAETDAQGIAHHASFVVWLEVARVAYLAEHTGGYSAIREQGIEALTTEVQVRYHRRRVLRRPADGLDALCRAPRRALPLRVRARARHRGRRTELVAEAATSHATVDAATWRPLRLPQSFIDAVARAES